MVAYEYILRYPGTFTAWSLRTQGDIAFLAISATTYRGMGSPLGRDPDPIAAGKIVLLVIAPPRTL